MSNRINTYLFKVFRNIKSLILIANEFLYSEKDPVNNDLRYIRVWFFLMKCFDRKNLKIIKAEYFQIR